MASCLEAVPVDKLESILECSICCETVKDPRTLPCFHSFCKSCLDRFVKSECGKTLLERKVNEFNCPNCRHQFTLNPGEEVADMKPNHFIGSMLDIMDVQNRVKAVPCSRCQAPSVCRCVTCEVFLCQNCRANHDTYFGSEKHNILSMDELSKPENQAMIRGRLYCQKHPKKTLKFYCKTCEELICRRCTDTTHEKPGHTWLPVENVAQKEKQLLSSKCAVIEVKLREGKKALKEISDATQSLEKVTEKVRRDITLRKDTILDAVKSQLNREAQSLLNQVDKIYHRKHGNLIKQKDEVESYTGQLEVCLNISKGHLEKATDEEILSSTKMIKANMKEVQNERPDCLKPADDGQMLYVCDPIDSIRIAHLSGAVGHIKEEIILADKINLRSNEVGKLDRRSNARKFLSLQEDHFMSIQPRLGETAQKPGISNLSRATWDKPTPDDKFQKDDTSYKKHSADNEYGKNALLNETQDLQEQMNLREEPSSVTVAKFIQHVYKEDLESFKSQNCVDVVLSDDRKTLTLKPMRGFNPSVMDEAARKLQQFYETTSKNVKRDVIDLKEFSADDAEKVERVLARQRGWSDVMVEESSPDVFILVGDAENVEMFRKNVMGALRRNIPHSEESKIPTKPMVASRKGTRVIFAFGELHKEQCDAMVNFTDKDLVHKSGLSCAIREAAGEEFWKACRDIISKNGSLFPYMVTTTTAGTLPCRLVIHAIVPDISKEKREKVLHHGLQEICHRVFTHAKENDVKSICFPVITPDIFNLSPAVSSRLLFDIIKEYIDKSRPLDGKPMEEIRIVYRKQSRCVEDYVKEYTKQF